MKHCNIILNDKLYQSFIEDAYEGCEEPEEFKERTPLLTICEQERHVHYQKYNMIYFNGDFMDVIESGEPYEYVNDFGVLKFGQPNPEVVILMNGTDVTFKYGHFATGGGDGPTSQAHLLFELNIPYVTGQIEMTFPEY